METVVLRRWEVIAGMDTPKHGETHKQVKADKRHPI